MKNSSEDLRDGIQCYQWNKKQIINNLRETIQLFKDVSGHLSPEVLACFNTEILVNTITDLGALISCTDDEEIENPAIAVLGTVKAGKSYFINSLLKKSVLPQSYSNCTARLTHLYYSKRNTLKIINSFGVIEKTKALRRRQVPDRYVKLSDGDRNNPTIVNSTIKVGLTLNFLKSGMDLIDTPGLGENATLTAVSKNIGKKVPIVIYVIDGNQSVKRSDIADLIEIKSNNPKLEIIYFITKLDTDDPSEYRHLSNVIDIAKSKMDLAFSTLKKNNLIPDSIPLWSDYSHFHGASLTKRLLYLDKRINPETTFHNELFSKFESSLLHSLLNYFRNKIDNSCDNLIEFNMAVLTKIINYAQNFANKVHENQTQISEIKKLEAELFAKIKEAISCSKEDLMKRLKERLQKDSDKIIDPIKDAEYPLSISIPRDGKVTDPTVIQQCQDNIRMVLVQGLENVIKGFVDDELFRKYKLAVETHFNTKISKQDNEKHSKTPYQRMLENLLDRNYKIERMSTFDDSNRNTTIEFMNVILVSLKDFLSNIFPQILRDNDVDVNNPAWKLKQAQVLLSKINIHLLAEDVCRKLIEDFEMKHSSFAEAMKQEMLFIKEEINNMDEIRFKVINTAPGFFQQLFNAVAIKGNYLFRNVKIVKERGEKNQPKLYESCLNGIYMARKEIRFDGKSNEEIQKIKERLSEEIYYSLLLSHERILPVLGVSMNEKQDNISMYYPLMKTDLKKYIQDNVLTQKEKLQMVYQVAEGLKYLHDHNIMHRDLKMENILLDDNNDVFLSDFGYIKSEALCNYSQIGTPENMAPEIINDRIYKKATNIYSFGKMMFHLFRVKGRLERNLITHRTGEMILELTKNLIKMLPDIPLVVSQLISDCCHENADERPTIEKILEVLSNVIDK